MVWRSPYRLIIGAPTSMADERADRSQLALAGSTLPGRATLQRRSHSILARARHAAGRWVEVSQTAREVLEDAGFELSILVSDIFGCRGGQCCRR